MFDFLFVSGSSEPGRQDRDGFDALSPKAVPVDVPSHQPRRCIHLVVHWSQQGIAIPVWVTPQQQQHQPSPTALMCFHGPVIYVYLFLVPLIVHF
jgi:hypothetical protein